MSDKVQPAVAIVIVNYNGYNDTLSCVKSLKCMDYGNYEIVIVDNNSTEQSAKRLKELKGITFIESSENQGFAGGTNLGIEHAMKNGSDFVLVLNNDTIVRESFLQGLISDMPRDKKSGIIGCKILDSQNRVWFAGGSVRKSTGATKILKKCRYDDLSEVDFVTGCMLLVKREVFERVGLFDERYFMYFEDVQFCYRARQNGYKIWFDPHVAIVHKTTGDDNRVFSAYFTVRNRQLFIREQLNNALLPRLLFYLMSYMKIAVYRLRGNKLHLAIAQAIRDYKMGKTGNTFNEDLFR